MPLHLLVPTADGADASGFNTIGGTSPQGTLWENVASNDGDGGYISEVVTDNRYSAICTELPAEAASVTSVAAAISARSASGTPNINTYIKLGASRTDGANMPITTSFLGYGQGVSLARPGGGAWTGADLRGAGRAEAGVRHRDAAIQEDVTLLYLEVLSSGEPQSFAFMVLSVMGALGTNLPHALMYRVARKVWERSGCSLLFLPHEYDALYQGLSAGTTKSVLVSK